MNQTARSCSVKGSQKVFQLHLGETNSCCRAYPESLAKFSGIDQLLEHWNKEKQQLESGVKIAGCANCWKDEDQGLPSYRQIYKHDLDTIEIFYSNLCNQMCSYCGPRYSSVWQQSLTTQGTIWNISNSAKNNLSPAQTHLNVDHWINEIQRYLQSCQDNSITVKLLGGEPLMQFNSLKTLLELNNSKIARLLINTNLNPPNEKFLKWLLETLPGRVGFHVSLDATPEFNHVPRAYFDSNKFLRNLDLVRNHSAELQIVSVLSALSTLDLDRFLTWLEKQNIKNEFFYVNNPDCMHPKYLPKHMKKEILEKTRDRMPAWFDHTMVFEESLVDLKQYEAYNYYTQYFQRSNIALDSIQHNEFQQYWTFLENKFK